jgi:prephenate dehydrogenase
MNIGIVGLGLMGGSIALKLKNAHTVHAYDVNVEALRYALQNGWIAKGHTDPATFFDAVEVVYLCIYPSDIEPFVLKHQHLAKPGSVWIDIAGVKETLIEHILPILRNDLDFVFTHPIAGREKVGVAFAKGSIFEMANYIITPTVSNRSSSLELAASLARELGFGTITKTDAGVHDDAIAYTSQLTHVLSLALVESGSDELDLSLYIGDSYRDLTRIAMINEPLWSELFLSNKARLLAKIDQFQETLSKYREWIEKSDKASLEQHMKIAKEKRKKIERSQP